MNEMNYQNEMRLNFQFFFIFGNQYRVFDDVIRNSYPADLKCWFN